jgi:gas vesicle protein
MGQSPEELRREIEQTREEMSRDVDAISDKVSPSRIVHRRVDRTKTAVSDLRERVMGSASSGAGTIGDKTSSAKAGISDAVTGAPDAAMSRTQGNPLAAGLMAFAVGMFAASLIPASSAETQAAQALEDKVKEPLKEGMGDVARQLKDDLQGPAQEAIESVKETATAGAQTVADQGKESAQTVRSEAQSASDEVRSSAS